MDDHVIATPVVTARRQAHQHISYSRAMAAPTNVWGK